MTRARSAAARLETARTDVTEARPGDEIVVETVLRPYRGERIVRQIPVKIPTSTPKGVLRILVSDGDTLDRMRRIPATLGRKLDLASTIALLNKEISSGQDEDAKAFARNILPTVRSHLRAVDGIASAEGVKH